MLVNTIKMWSSQETLGGQRDNTLLAGHISQAARVLGITVNLDQNHEMTEEFIEEKNFLVSLNTNHIEAYAIKSEPFQRTNLQFRPHKLKYPQPTEIHIYQLLYYSILFIENTETRDDKKK